MSEQLTVDTFLPQTSSFVLTHQNVFSLLSRCCEHTRRPGPSEYCAPELICIGDASSLIQSSSERPSKSVAKKLRALIRESNGALFLSAKEECQKLGVSLSMVSREFKKAYRIGIRSYARRMRMRQAGELLTTHKHLNVDEVSRMLGYKFTPAFSRCFQEAFGQRPKEYQMRRKARLSLSLHAHHDRVGHVQGRNKNRVPDNGCIPQSSNRSTMSRWTQA